MREDQVRRSPCWRCIYKEYHTRWDAGGQQYREWQCYYGHWERFGRRDTDAHCPEYRDVSQDAIE